MSYDEEGGDGGEYNGAATMRGLEEPEKQQEEQEAKEKDEVGSAAPMDLVVPQSTLNLDVESELQRWHLPEPVSSHLPHQS